MVATHTAKEGVGAGRAASRRAAAHKLYREGCEVGFKQIVGTASTTSRKTQLPTPWEAEIPLIWTHLFASGIM